MKYFMIVLIFLLLASKCKKEEEQEYIWVDIVDITFHQQFDSLLDDHEMPGAFFDNWGRTDSIPFNYYKGTIHWTPDTIPYLLFQFEGTRFEIYGMKDRHLAIMQVRYGDTDLMIDNYQALRADTLVDNYSPVRLDTSGVLYSSPKMDWGWHWVHIRNTGLMNDSARHHHLIIDAVRVIADTPIIKQKQTF